MIEVTHYFPLQPHKTQCISKTVWYLDFYQNSFINLRNPRLCVVSRSRCPDLLLMCWPWQVESPWCWWSAQNAETCTLDIGRLSPGPAELHLQRSSHAASCTGWRRFDGGACRYWLWTMTRSWEQNSDSVGTQFIGGLCCEWTPQRSNPAAVCWGFRASTSCCSWIVHINIIYSSLFIAHSFFNQMTWFVFYPLLIFIYTVHKYTYIYMNAQN